MLGGERTKLQVAHIKLSHSRAFSGPGLSAANACPSRDISYGNALPVNGCCSMPIGTGSFGASSNRWRIAPYLRRHPGARHLRQRELSAIGPRSCQWMRHQSKHHWRRTRRQLLIAWGAGKSDRLICASSQWRTIMCSSQRSAIRLRAGARPCSVAGGCAIGPSTNGDGSRTMVERADREECAGFPLSRMQACAVPLPGSRCVARDERG